MYDDVEVTSPHRSIRVGKRTYPATFTNEDENMKSAVIPTENGGLVSFSVTPGSPVAHLNAPHVQVTPPAQRGKLPKAGPMGLFKEVGTVHGVEDFHNSMSSLSKIKIDPEARRHNQQIMMSHQQLFHDRRGS
jgi:hypothetical protein